MVQNGASTFYESISIKLDEAVGSASISPSGRDVCLAARKGLFIVDLDDPWATPRFLPHYSEIVADVQWSPHPSRAHWVVSTSGSKALVWNLAVAGGTSSSTDSGTSGIEHVCLGHERSITDINWAVFQFDSLATCGIDGNVLCYDLRLGGQRPTARYSGWRFAATQVKYNRQNPHELASAHGELLLVWDDRKGSSPVTTIKAHDQKIYGIDYSRRQKNNIVTCSLDGTVKYWNLDGSFEQHEPTQIVKTSSPVWRARHTPFGDGLVTLSQRSEHSVKMWTPHSPEHPVYTLQGHNDVVREFLWRTRGGDNPVDDDREFQLVTWGSDRQLLLTPISNAVTRLVGHVPHSPIEVRQTRRNAENRSFRDVLPSPSGLLQSSDATTTPAGSSLPQGRPGSGRSTSLKPSSMECRMPPPNALNGGSSRIPLTSASAYGRSANSATTGSQSSTNVSPHFGTSPADSKAVLSGFRDGRHRPPPLLGLAAPRGAAGFMTRGNIHRRNPQDPVAWMENVRVVSTTTVGSEKPSAGHTNATYDIPETESVARDKDIVPLHEEITAAARAFEGRVRFDKIAIPARTVVAALYGPWTATGLTIFLRVTFVFPPAYPRVPLTIDIERTSGLSNKVRAKVLTSVRNVAARYARGQRNALEAVLIFFLGGKVPDPDAVLDNYDEEALLNSQEEILVAELGDAEGNVETEADLERLLANRNCPPPRRCGAVFSPQGILYTFHPMDPVSSTGLAEKRIPSRSASPSPARHSDRPKRRRLFESFGVVPLLSQDSQEAADDEEVDDEADHDSDEVLNIPSLVLAQRRRSWGQTESVTASHSIGPRLTGTGRAFNTRVYVQSVRSLIGSDPSLSADFVFRGSFSDIVEANDESVRTSSVPEILRRGWSGLRSLLPVMRGQNGEVAGPSPVVLGHQLAEKVILESLAAAAGLGDLQILGLLACLLEIDRRALHQRVLIAPKSPRKLHRSPGAGPAADYFSIKPPIQTRSSDSLARHQYRGAVSSVSAVPLKSPREAVLATSYGTMASGSSGRGSSWANNLSSFFKSAGAGRVTTPAEYGVAPPSPGSLSPAFTKRAASVSHSRAVGGIATAKPQYTASTNRSKPTTHVSFAASDAVQEVAPSRIGGEASNKLIISKRIRIQRTEDYAHAVDESFLLQPAFQLQLEFYRLQLADFLLRMQLPHQRAEVLKLTSAAVSGEQNSALAIATGQQISLPGTIALELACPVCGSLLGHTSIRFCQNCQRSRSQLPCALCHLPLSGLTEICVACLHATHLECMEEWRTEDDVCPASCGCNCTRVQLNGVTSPTQILNVKSPSFIT